MSIIYNPKPASRPNDFQIVYHVNRATDPWFIPYNDTGTDAEKVARCKTMVGTTTDGSDCGSGAVPS